MPEPTATRTSSACGAVLAPYALVRGAAAAYPGERAASAAFRGIQARLTVLETELAALAPVLCDALYVSSGTHSAEFHRDVVLPLRRAVFNGREPAIDRLGDLPHRVPELAAWLGARAEHKAACEQLAELTAEALTADRENLTELCADPALRKAIALTSEDLLRAVLRTSTAPDKRGRKAEPTVLRYALRASTKTSPLSWFTLVGWGRLDDHGASDGWPSDAHLAIVTTSNRALVETFLDAVLTEERSRALPHHLTSEPRIEDGQARFLRTRLQLAGGRFLTSAEDEVTVAHSGPLGLVVTLARKGIPLDDLIAELTNRLGKPADRYVGQLVKAGLLVPSAPIDPQSTDAVRDLADWLRPDPLAAQLDGIADATAAFGTTEPEQRQRALNALGARWTALFEAIGRPGPAAPVLTEDVVIREPLPLGGFLSPDDHTALGEIAAVAEHFDLGHTLRAALRERFVARYGDGGVCRRPWEFASEVRDTWKTLAVVEPGPTSDHPLDEVTLPEALVREAVETSPHRPMSYSFFVQNDPDTGLLCVNHLHGGWGRFTSRFLPSLDPAAAEAVSRQIRGHLARPVQIRPVGGFNANLHPRLVADELGNDPRWSSLTESDLELFDDGTELRLRLKSTGEPLDVLYPGFLAPVMLPDRLAPFLNDFPTGLATFRKLIPHHTTEIPGGVLTRTPRLRHGNVVLRRRRWLLEAGTVAKLSADLAAEEVPFRAVAKWRALLGLPEQVFLHPAAPADGERSAAGLLKYLQQPKPHLADLGSALHLRSLRKWLSRHENGAVFEEALPAAGGRAQPRRAVELVVETYRNGSPQWT
ncbi:lantibiotic dehydratase [Amycolatopsis sp. cg5]|uniref:lantibiotic dehydratase n=1 Tax=Amycolatopsis sp. cg5 TaxID=3238802 RepID=UPI003524F98B